MDGTGFVALGALFASAINLLEIKKLKGEIEQLKAVGDAGSDRNDAPADS